MQRTRPPLTLPVPFETGTGEPRSAGASVRDCRLAEGTSGQTPVGSDPALRRSLRGQLSGSLARSGSRRVRVRLPAFAPDGGWATGTSNVAPVGAALFLPVPPVPGGYAR